MGPCCPGEDRERKGHEDAHFGPINDFGRFGFVHRHYLTFTIRFWRGQCRAAANDSSRLRLGFETNKVKRIHFVNNLSDMVKSRIYDCGVEIRATQDKLDSKCDRSDLIVWATNRR